MNNKQCPHLNCLVYHPDGVCNCHIEDYCPQCKGERPRFDINNNWEEEFDERFTLTKEEIKEGWFLDTDSIKQFIKSILSQREAEIRKETIKAVMKITDKGFDCVCSGHIKDLAKEKFNITI
jgi:hypothetical protein